MVINRRCCRGAGAGLLLCLGGAAIAVPAAAAPKKGAPAVALEGPRSRRPPAPFPSTLRLEIPYARTWDAVVAVLASRGFPLQVVARDSGVVATGWRITQPNHQVTIGREDFLGRKAERLTVLIRPLPQGTQVSITGQSALVSPQWSAAGMPPVGQAVDIPSDTVTEYGLLYDVASVLGLALKRVPDPAYGLALARAGIFERPPRPAAAAPHASRTAPVGGLGTGASSALGPPSPPAGRGAR